MVAKHTATTSGAATVALLEERAQFRYLLPDRRDARSREQLLARVRAEFEEMPCLRLTLAQAVRLFALREDVCARVLATLVNERALWRGLDGQYARHGR
jgi:hypothetical protein